MNFNERKTIHIDLCLGMRSEENSIQRLGIIKQTQQQLAQEVAAGVASGALTPQAFKKMRKPYEDTLYVLGVKDADTYLPTEDEVIEMIQAAQQAKQNAQPSPEDQARLARAQLDTAKAEEINAEIAGNTADKQLEAYSLMAEGKARAYGP